MGAECAVSQLSGHHQSIGPLSIIVGNHDRRLAEAPRLQRRLQPLDLADWAILGRRLVPVIRTGAPAIHGLRPDFDFPSQTPVLVQELFNRFILFAQMGGDIAHV